MTTRRNDRKLRAAELQEELKDVFDWDSFNTFYEKLKDEDYRLCTKRSNKRAFNFTESRFSSLGLLNYLLDDGYTTSQARYENLYRHLKVTSL